MTGLAPRLLKISIGQAVIFFTFDKVKSLSDLITLLGEVQIAHNVNDCDSQTKM